jgi:hypothetical protein
MEKSDNCYALPGVFAQITLEWLSTALLRNTMENIAKCALLQVINLEILTCTRANDVLEKLAQHTEAFVRVQGIGFLRDEDWLVDASGVRCAYAMPLFQPTLRWTRFGHQLTAVDRQGRTVRPPWWLLVCLQK